MNKPRFISHSSVVELLACFQFCITLNRSIMHQFSLGIHLGGLLLDHSIGLYVVLDDKVSTRLFSYTREKKIPSNKTSNQKQKYLKTKKSFSLTQNNPIASVDRIYILKLIHLKLHAAYLNLSAGQIQHIGCPKHVFSPRKSGHLLFAYFCFLINQCLKIRRFYIRKLQLSSFQFPLKKQNIWPTFPQSNYRLEIGRSHCIYTGLRLPLCKLLTPCQFSLTLCGLHRHENPALPFDQLIKVIHISLYI